MSDWATEFDDLPVLGSVGEQIERAARQDESRHRGWVSRLSRRTRVGGVIVVGLVFASGVAVAARQLIQTGQPVPTHPHEFGGLRSSFSQLAPGSARVLGLRVADPGGGPPWGLRIFRERSGLVCTQAGRVVNGQLGVLGQDGAFHNDHRFHPLPLIADGCSGPMDANGQLAGNGFSNAQAASALVFSGGIPGAGGCETKNDRKGRFSTVASLKASLRTQLRRHETALARVQRRVIARYEKRARQHIPLCPDNDLRSVLYGFAGSAATNVALTEATTTHTIRPTAADSGAYMFVLPGDFAQHQNFTIRRYYPHGIMCPVPTMPGVPVPAAIGDCSPPPGYTGVSKRLKLPGLPVAPKPAGTTPPPPLHTPVNVTGLTIRLKPPHAGVYTVALQCATTNNMPELSLNAHSPTRLPGGHTATLRLRNPPPFCKPTGHGIHGHVTDTTNGQQIATFTLNPGTHG